jgi:hypothetical protein
MRKLTPEIIESCLELGLVEALGRADAKILEEDAWQEIQAFNDHLVSNERLHAGLLDIICAVFDEPVEGAQDVSKRKEHFYRLLKSGRVTLKHAQVITNACRQFFFLGWYSRDAAEKAKRHKVEAAS